MRPPYVGHRRYSITHRAVQRLRELVPGRDEEDDETLRDTLDQSLGEAEDGGRAIRTLDAMLSEPQTLIPIETFGDLLYAIVKEDTVVTVLPRGHGEEILSRGQAMEQRVASGQATVRPVEPRTVERRWRKDGNQPVVIERIGRAHSATHEDGHDFDSHDNDDHDDDTSVEDFLGALDDEDHDEHEADDFESHNDHEPAEAPISDVNAQGELFETPEFSDEPVLEGPIDEALYHALTEGRRRALIAALREMLAEQDLDADLLPVWNELAEQGVPRMMTVGDFIEAVRKLDEAS